MRSPADSPCRSLMVIDSGSRAIAMDMASKLQQFDATQYKTATRRCVLTASLRSNVLAGAFLQLLQPERRQ